MSAAAIREAPASADGPDARGSRQPEASHRLQILLFSLGGAEIFGINVFKVREVALTPPITRTPNTVAGLEGVISLRGRIIPVIDVARFAGVETASADRCSTLLVTEFCGRCQGLMVSDVDRIVRVGWEQVDSPARALLENGLVTAVTRLPDGRMVSIVDVEQVLACAFGEARVPAIEPLPAGAQASLLFADDSPVARRAVTRVLEQLGARCHQAANGREAWEMLMAIAAQAELEGVPLSERLRLILTDAEMPQMDGYALARSVKSDPRFEGIPVVMHTSLPARVSVVLARAVDVDAYIPKFDPVGLADALRPMLRPQSPAS